jgi:hypothetical protein
MSKHRCALILWGALIIFLRAGAENVNAAPTPSTVSVPAAQQSSPEQQLADRFAPIAYLRQQEEPCDRKGEGYFPAPIEVILGNPSVALKQNTADNADDDPIVMMGPTAQDLADKDDTYYLDLPGDPRHPGCTFETDFKNQAAQTGAQPTTYARIVTDASTNQLALQYWFWYYFDDWNNSHESDWEMVQLIFDVPTVEEALATDPTYVGYAQHGGGELADWTDPKILRDGDHIYVYPGAGSHATYYDEQVYIGWGEGGTGFGCDNTSAPTTATPLTAVLIPDTVDASSPFAWLLYDGRWGQREPWEYNGPVGPNQGAKWNTPISTMDNWRTSSLKLPGGERTAGPTATSLFCGLSSAGSRVLMEVGTRPWLLLTLIAAFFLIVIGLFVGKRQELREALSFYGANLKLFVLIGLFTIPIGIVFNAFQLLIRENPPVEWVVKWFNDTASARLTAAAIAGGLQQVAMALIISPPIIQAIHDLRRGERPSLAESFRRGYRHFRPIFTALVLVTIAAGLLCAIIIGIPIAIWLVVRWQFYGQAAVLDGSQTGRTAIARSRRAVGGRWWEAFGDSLIFQLIAIIPGPFIGALLMILGKATVDFANVFSSVVYAITVPISIIGLTFAYIRYRDRPAETPAPEAGPIPAVGSAPAGD